MDVSTATTDRRKTQLLHINANLDSSAFKGLRTFTVLRGISRRYRSGVCVCLLCDDTAIIVLLAL